MRYRGIPCASPCKSGWGAHDKRHSIVVVLYCTSDMYSHVSTIGVQHRTECVRMLLVKHGRRSKEFSVVTSCLQQHCCTAKVKMITEPISFETSSYSVSCCHSVHRSDAPGTILLCCTIPPFYVRTGPPSIKTASVTSCTTNQVYKPQQNENLCIHEQPTPPYLNPSF